MTDRKSGRIHILGIIFLKLFTVNYKVVALVDFYVSIKHILSVKVWAEPSVSLLLAPFLWIRAETQTGIPHHPRRTQAPAIQLKSD